MTPAAAPVSPHRQLVLDDVVQSLTGVRASLGLDAQGLPQAALHARDLCQALATAGLRPLADVMSEVAQRLSQGEIKALYLARGLAPFIEQWVEHARQGHLEPDSVLLAQLEHWRCVLDEPAAGGIDAPVDNLAPPAQRPLARQGLDAGVIHEQGLAALARIRADMGGALGSLRSIDLRLSAFEDWLVGVGQYALSDLYPAPGHHVQGAWVDQTLADFLKNTLDWADRARLIRADVLQLTLRLDWVGARLDAAELASLARQLLGLDGRVEPLDEGGYRLWVPATRARMRLQTFSQNGHRFAVSAALLRQMPVQGDGLLHLGVGDHPGQSLAVEALGGQAPMNLYPLPACVPVPRSVVAVAVDPAGAVYPVVRPEVGI